MKDTNKLKKLFEIKLTIQELEKGMTEKQKKFVDLRADIRSTAQKIGELRQNLFDSI